MAPGYIDEQAVLQKEVCPDDGAGDRCHQKPAGEEMAAKVHP